MIHCGKQYPNPHGPGLVRCGHDFLTEEVGSGASVWEPFQCDECEQTDAYLSALIDQEGEQQKEVA